jgi:predicted DNA-binding protein (MmcQ/YjbR family)
MTTASPFWPALQQYCLSFAGAVEEYPWNEVVYKVKGKTFVFTSGDRPEIVISVKTDPAMRPVWLQQPGVSVAQYVGRFGWLTVRIADQAAFDLAKDMIAESYGLVSGKRT